MKNTSSTLWNNLSSKSTNNRLMVAEMEFISDDIAHHIRGGDKFYMPLYEGEINSRTRFFLPSIL
ncbi:hypothetical protein LV89_03099 [Arcicella aurantiaca]|uniref:Uncharacterized protein n=1 Tax=Arcicella aurantiaca TaxID=591202 RepID=A0A316E2W4_9BACT|nr:hypothetical protein [Arcicella aurantiaca]PWK23892.1 hypothetical protein LV89_03099 [Arcicella aurantiaca]